MSSKINKTDTKNSFSLNGKIAVFNRGEAAVRFIRGLYDFNKKYKSSLKSVLFLTEEEKNSSLVKMADEIIILSNSEGYSVSDSLISKLKKSNCDALWPGWGFASENPLLPELLDKNSIVFLGPGKDAILTLGDKIESKKAAESADIPVIPWHNLKGKRGLKKAGISVGYPLILKASGGGGGRGIRIVDSDKELNSDYDSVTNEAPGNVFMEKYIIGGRHIEVQIVADGNGNANCYGLRDCSLQRRRQKVIEEAPSFALSKESEKKILNWARKLAVTVNYQSAGTVEFLYKSPKEIYFLEMNPRLQVEHGVTEQAYGVDLVEAQILAALGRPLPVEPKKAIAHSIEARIYAEDPASGFLPSPGKITNLRFGEGPGIRIDSGVVLNDEISSSFDPMIAKVIATGNSRNEALARLNRSLEESSVHIENGTTNISFLKFLLKSEIVNSGDFSTEYIDTVLLNKYLEVPENLIAPASISATILEYLKRERELVNNFAVRPMLTGAPDTTTFINLSSAHGDSSIRIRQLSETEFLIMTLDGYAAVHWIRESETTASVNFAGLTHSVSFESGRGEWRIIIDDYYLKFVLQERGVIKSPSPAMVNAVHVKKGSIVHKGDILFTLEAMKMELPVICTDDGIVEQIDVLQGAQVFAGGVLARLRSETKQESQLLHIKLPELFPDPLTALAIIKASIFGYDSDKSELEIAFKSLTQFKDDELATIFSSAFELVIEAADIINLTSPLRKFNISVPTPKSASGRALLSILIRKSNVVFHNLPDNFTKLLSRVTKTYGQDDLEPGPFLTYSLFRLRKVLNQSALKRRAITDLLAFLSSSINLLPPPPLELTDALKILSADIKGSTRQTDLSEYLRDILFDTPVRINKHNENIALLNRFIKNPAGFIDEVAKVIRTFNYEEISMIFPLLKNDEVKFKVLHLMAFYFWGEYLIKSQNCTIFNPSLKLVVGNRISSSRSDSMYRLFLATDTVLDALESVKQRDLNEFSSMEIVLEKRLLSDDEISKILTEYSLDLKEISFVFLNEFEVTTFRCPIGNAFVVENSLASLHPASAARVELWKFSQFRFTTLPNKENVHLFSINALKQEEDNRLLAMVEVFDPVVERDYRGKPHMPALSLAFRTACQSIREYQAKKDKLERLHWNHLVLSITPMPELSEEEMKIISAELVPYGSRLGLDQVIVYSNIEKNGKKIPWQYKIRGNAREGLSFEHGPTDNMLFLPAGEKSRHEIKARRRGINSVESVLRIIKQDLEGATTGNFKMYDIVVDPFMGEQHIIETISDGVSSSVYASGVVFGILDLKTIAHPDGLKRVTIISNPLQNMGSLSEHECRRIIGAITLAEEKEIPIYWIPISAGAKIDFESGTENLDWTARVLRKIVEFTESGGIIDILVGGINVGAQSYFDAEATMVSGTKGFLAMTEDGAMVLTGKRALDVSGAVSAEDNLGIGGGERIMGPTGQAQATVKDLSEGHQLLLNHSDLIIPSNGKIAVVKTKDDKFRDISVSSYPISLGHGFSKIGAIFNEETNPGRKKPFSVKPVMDALRDNDAPVIDRWGNLSDGAEGVVVWETRIGGIPTGILGIEAMSFSRVGQIPSDGPESWNPSTLFPKGAYKLSRSISAFNNQVPIVILANLAGFDGSPESMRKWQLIHGAQIGRALVKFQGPVMLVVLSRYHGGAYVVFSTALNEDMETVALKGSYASVIGGSAAASVVFNSSIIRKVSKNKNIIELRKKINSSHGRERMTLEAEFTELQTELKAKLYRETAERFDEVHSVERAAKVGSLKSVIEPSSLRPYVIDFLSQKLHI